MNDNELVARLLKLKNIINEDIYNAVVTKANLAGNKAKIDQILIDDYKIDRDVVYTEIAQIYAIPKIDLKIEKLSDSDISEVKELINSLPDEIKEDVYKIKNYTL